MLRNVILPLQNCVSHKTFPAIYKEPHPVWWNLSTGSDGALPYPYTYYNSGRLLQGNLCSLCFQFRLDLFCLCLCSSFLDYLRSAVYHLFGFLQAQAGSFTNNLDNFNFVRANFGQLNVELSLLFFSGSLACSACCCNNNACCCGYAELFLTCFYQLVQL